MKDLIISLAVNGREDYVYKSRKLEASIRHLYFDVRLYKEYPEWCTKHSDVPYKFKYDLIKKAVEDGYSRIFWLDSSMRVQKDLKPLLDNSEKGVVAFDNLGHPLYKYISDKATRNFNLSEEELRSIPQTWGGALFFDFNKAECQNVFNDIMQQANIGSFDNGDSAREGFVAHRHDQAVCSCVFYQHNIKLLPYGVIVGSQHAKEPFEYGNDYYLVYGD